MAETRVAEIRQADFVSDWTLDQARNLYQIPAWSEGYFDINEAGHLVALPRKEGDKAIDLYELALRLKKDGQTPPVLLRFTDILQHRVHALCDSFHQAMHQNEYTAPYTAVYPIKVNQQRKVVEDIIRHGGGNIGLEAGSKPELLTSIALATPGSTVICNGYKDQEYVRVALIGQQLGLRVFIVVEKLSELRMMIRIAGKMGVRPRLGVRVRLAAVAAGKWQNTGGEKSKFGLHSEQVIRAVEELRAADMLDCLNMLHFHIGSQVSNIRHFQRALREGTRFYLELRKMGAPLATVDVGGGLGVDYEGTQSRNYCSVNYTMQDYAETVVHAFADACRQHNLPQPEIITEAGRAMTAHHAMLITNVIGVEHAPGVNKPAPARSSESPAVRDLWKILQSINKKRAVPAWNDALNHYEEAKELFVHGLLDLRGRARVEEIFYSVCRKVQGLLKYDQQDLRNELNEKLADKYFCNFSLFQSMPDSWAIDQIFPIVPLHRLNERPTQRAMIEDLTCDSDGMVKHYVDGEGINTSLSIHKPAGDEPYLIGVFLLGAYQEILGDMHNLFGDTASVNIELIPGGKYQLTEIHQGDTVADLLDYVHINVRSLEESFRQKIAAAGLAKELRIQYLDELVQGLGGYTYLED
ncbi:MAG: biosynthetic arginine decarboxylase [Gammaproteobacteria bacterium]